MCFAEEMPSLIYNFVLNAGDRLTNNSNFLKGKNNEKDSCFYSPSPCYDA
jgi:hypothetical protein